MVGGNQAVTIHVMLQAFPRTVYVKAVIVKKYSLLREAVGSIPTTDQSDLKLLVCRRFHIILHNCSFQVSYGHNTTELFDTC